MAQEPKELQLYQVKFNAQGSVMLSNVAVKGNSTGTTADAIELAEAVRQLVNSETGLEYQTIYVNCIGSVYIWRTI